MHERKQKESARASRASPETPEKHRAKSSTMGSANKICFTRTAAQDACPNGKGVNWGNSCRKVSVTGPIISGTSVPVLPHPSTPRRAFFANTGLISSKYGELGEA